MPALSRRSLLRRGLMLLPGLALVTAACSAEADTGLRGNGTVLFPRDRTPAQPSRTDVAAEPTLTARVVPTATPEPTVSPELIVPADAIPAVPPGSSEAEMHVIPLVSGKLRISPALPARRVVIPTIGVDSKVIQLGTKLDRNGHIAWETAPFAVGQHKGLAGPGENGNMVLSGHISSPAEGAVFHKLPQLKVDEGVIVTTEERQYLYRVTNVKTVTPDQVSVLDQTPDPTLTVITCVPDGIYSHRLVVTARLV
jgi:LPXTG-site transpeptidase (sortase) family protein